MRIVGGLDVHRRQITFDYVDERSGQTRRGRIAPADRMLLRRWLATTFDGAPAAFAVEACTGWRFVVEELQRAGIEAHLAEPADTAAARGPKRRAKTDRTEARHLRELLAGGRLPESRIPPEQVLKMRAKLELFKDLREEHTAWVQRIHAILLHQGAPAIAGDLLGADNPRPRRGERRCALSRPPPSRLGIRLPAGVSLSCSLRPCPARSAMRTPRGAAPSSRLAELSPLRAAVVSVRAGRAEYAARMRNRSASGDDAAGEERPRPDGPREGGDALCRTLAPARRTSSTSTRRWRWAPVRRAPSPSPSRSWTRSTRTTSSRRRVRCPHRRTPAGDHPDRGIPGGT